MTASYATSEWADWPVSAQGNMWLPLQGKLVVYRWSQWKVGSVKSKLVLGIALKTHSVPEYEPDFSQRLELGCWDPLEI